MATSPPVSASKITKSALNAVLLRYDGLITHLSSSSPSSLNTKPPTPDLKTLNHLRYTEIPHRLAARKKDGESIDGKGGGGGGGGAHLEKAEVEDLVRWKLRHGTFRPRLTQLVASNSAASVRDTTRRAFALYAGDGEEEGEAYMSAIKMLATLKGVGPATASLLLAVYDPVRVPFFADELFWWVCCGGEWGKGIRYTVGEYKALWEGVKGLRGRLNAQEGAEAVGEGEGVRAVELEKAAWVLGWEARGGGGGGGGGKKGRTQPTGKTEKEVGTGRATKKRKIANGSGADGESRPDNERDLDNVNASTPNRPNKTPTTSAPPSAPEPDRPISPPPKRQLSHPNPSNSKNEPAADRPLRRSKRTNLP